MTLPSDPLAWAVKAFKDSRNQRYSVYENYLAGNQPLVFATDKFRSAFGTIFSAFAYNRMAMVVDAHSDRMHVSGFGADDPDVSQAAQDLWDANLMDIREGHAYADQFGTGDGYVIAEMHPTTGNVQYWVQSPQNVRVHWDGEAPNQLDLGAKLWFDDDQYCRVNLYFVDRVEKYISINRAPGGIPSGSGHFQRYDLDTEPWSFKLNVTDTVPIFHFANNARTNQYGMSELQSILPLQDAVNKTLMDMMVAMEFAAYPQRILIGVETDNANEDELLNRFQVGIDRILKLAAPDSKVAEFSAANIAQYLAVAEFFDKTVSRVSKVPVHYLGMSGDFSSGVSRRIAESPFTSKIEDRQRSDGAVVADLQRYGLRLQGMDVQPGDLRVNWKSAAPLSEEDELDLGLQKQMLGYPLVTILRENGYEPDQIDAIMKEKAAALDEARMAFNRGDVSPGFGNQQQGGQ